MSTWNYDMGSAPRNGRTFIMIAVKNSKKIRRCVWNQYTGKWTGLIGNEEPLAFMLLTHPEIGKSKDLFQW